MNERGYYGGRAYVGEQAIVPGSQPSKDRSILPPFVNDVVPWIAGGLAVGIILKRISAVNDRLAAIARGPKYR